MRAVEPTPKVPADVILASSEAEDHFGLFSGLLSTAKTSSTGRLIVVLTSALAMTRSSNRFGDADGEASRSGPSPVIRLNCDAATRSLPAG